jgi:N-acetylmuramoyl-L-alanine amidase
MAIASLLLLPAAEAAFKIRSARVGGQMYLYLRDIAGFYGMQFQASGRRANLSSRYSKLRFEVDKRECILNGVKVNLSYAVGSAAGEIAISQTDFNLLLEPIMRTRTLPAGAVGRIVIDPGHGGSDEGAANHGVKEKELTLSIARRLYLILNRQGYQVYLTRSSDRRVSLDQRVSAAQAVRPDLFISLHINAVGNARVNGLETFFLTPEGTPSTYSSNTKREADLGNAFDTENARLAYEIQKQLTAVTGATDRGIKHANFVVLRDASCPSVLVEMGFLTNPGEEEQLITAAYQNKLALGLARGIVAFDRAKRKAGKGAGE